MGVGQTVPGFTADDVQKLIDALPSSGGTVTLQSGATYTFNRAVTVVDRTNVRICGDGSVTIEQTTDHTPNFVVQRCTSVHMSQLNLIKGNICVLESTYCSFTKLHLTNTDEAGILLDGQQQAPGCFYNTVDGCVIVGAGRVGISQNMVTDSTIVNNICIGCANEGLTVDNMSDRCIVRGNRFSGNLYGVGQIGIDKSCHCIFDANILTGCVQAPTSGITFKNNIGSTDYNVLSNNVFMGNQRYGVEFITSSKGSCSSNVVSGNRFEGNVLGSILIQSSGSTNNVVTSNSLGGGAFANNGTGTVVQGNASQDAIVDVQCMPCESVC
eukprot:TRINITY_DN3409_c0_g5_i1.p1 TRINITY_DN3409_c0_g5~~TRINITY_DN3409_c0_g5_i1.p1  ORF type:complete len:381 (+),score=107.20 TRINITY_DN3409_c0_g5_i1:168-1145(+)